MGDLCINNDRLSAAALDFATAVNISGAGCLPANDFETLTSLADVIHEFMQCCKISIEAVSDSAGYLTLAARNLMDTTTELDARLAAKAGEDFLKRDWSV